MPKWRLLALLATLVLCTLLVASCSDDDNDTVTPPGDTTAPLVSGTWPEDDATDIGPGAGISVIFNEDMDPTSAAGNVTLSNSNITGLTWETERILVIAHSDFVGEGVEVTVTLGTGLKDAAGNGLAAPFSWSFYTTSSVVTLLDFEPEEGAVDVPRQPMIRLLFSEGMNTSTLYGAISVTDQLIMKRALFTYDLEQGDGDWYYMTFPDPLPADTQLWVTISTSAQAWDGTNLSQGYLFSFHTTTDADTEPPQLISIVPPNGLIDPNTSNIVFTFDEPIDPTSFREKGICAELQLLIMFEMIGEPTWNDDFTQMTIVLPTPLAAGLPLEIVFDEFADLAGNVQQTDTTYRVTVSGTPDFFPVEDEATYGMAFVSQGGNLGMPPSWDGDYEKYFQFSVQSGDDFQRREFNSPTLQTQYLSGWDKLRKTGDRIYIGGFHDVRQGEGEEDITFDDDLVYLKQSFVAGDSWSGTTDVTAVWTPLVGSPESFSGNLDYAMRVLPKIDKLPVGPDEGPRKLDAVRLFRAPAADEGGIYWLDVWPMELTHMFYTDQDTMSTGIDTLYYAPARGLVQKRTYEEEYDESDEWGYDRGYWFPFDPMMIDR